MPAPLHLLQSLRGRIAHAAGTAAAADDRLALEESFGLRGIDEALAGGLPRGGVVEITAPMGRGRATSLALIACAAAQQRAVSLGGSTWCAWVDPSRSLYGPGVEAQRVDPSRFLLALPEPALFPRTVVRVAESRAFSVVVADASQLGPEQASLERWPTTVRRLSLAVEGTDCTVLLLTDAGARRSLPLPTAARIELSRSTLDAVSMRVAKDRFGKITTGRSVPWSPP